MRIYTIYRAVCSSNGKSYIGFTSKWPDRINDHKYAYEHDVDYAFYRAMRKHGWEAFDWSILYQSKDEVHTKSVMEPYFIRAYNSHITKNGYNMTLGGEGFVGLPMTKEHKQKIGDSNRGKKHQPEFGEAISKRRTGVKLGPHTVKHRAKISASLKGRSYSQERRKAISDGHKGRSLSEAHKKAIRAASLGKKRGPYKKRTHQQL